MNSYLRIKIKVAVEQAEALDKLLKGLGKIGAAGAGAGKTAVAGVSKELEKARTTLDQLKLGTRNSGFGALAEDAANLAARVRDLQAAARNDALPRWARTTVSSLKEVQRELNAVGVAMNYVQGRRNNQDLVKINQNLAGVGKVENVGSHQKLAAQKAREEAAAAAATAKAWQQAETANQNAGWKATQAKRAAEEKAARDVAAAWQKSNSASMQDGWKATQQKTAAEAKAAAEVRAQWQRTNTILYNEGVKADRAEAQAKVDAERRALSDIQRMQRQYNVGQVTGKSYKASLGNIAKSAPMGSNVNLAASEALKKYDDAQKKAALSAQLFNERTQRLKPSLIDMGKQVQWVGRQLEYNFTLPILAAGRQVFELAMANETALTRVVKVYGQAEGATEDLSTKFLLLGQRLGQLPDSATPFEREAWNLGRAMRALSDHFGVNLEKVSDLNAMWAATGRTGLDLAMSTKLTLETMLVGDIDDQTEAFKTLVAVQGAYKLTTEQLRQGLANLNLVENITAAQFGDLVKVFARAGSAAATAGVDFNELAGIAAVLVPAYGSAETVGNALKTIFTRIIAPGNQANDVLEAMGINIQSNEWLTKSATERLQFMAQTMEGLTSNQRLYVERLVASNYQINKFDALMKDLNDTGGVYARVMAAFADAQDGGTRSMEIFDKEIDKMLTSTPAGIKIALNELRNLGNDILGYLLPSILKAATGLKFLVEQFRELSPTIQKAIVGAIVFVALLGPTLRLVGAFAQLFGIFGKVGKALMWLIGLFLGEAAAKTVDAVATEALTAAEAEAAAASGALAVLSNPWVLLAAAVLAAVAAIYIFRDKLKPVFDWIANTAVRVFNMLPQSIQNALSAVVRIVAGAAMAVYHWLQYMNPFARHSPSLVDSVNAGVDAIVAKYQQLRGIGSIFRKAADDLKAFKDVSADALAAQGTGKRNEQRANVAQVTPEALPAFDQLVGDLIPLNAALDQVKAAMDDQQAVVDALQKSYDGLSNELDRANDLLDAQQTAAQAIKDQLDAAQAEATKWANAPIQGMKAYTDAIFENELEQKKLRLAMMDIEDAVGPLDKLRDKMANLAGEIEQMRAMQTDLRQAGAGSEITGPLQDQIDALEAQRQSYVDQVAPLQDLQDQLEALQRTGERLDLEEAIKFDPLRKQIDDAANAIEEFPFDVILKGLVDSKARVNDLTKAYDDASNKVKDQQKIVDDLDSARKILGTTLDAEKDKLDELNKVYGDFKDRISDIETALDDMASAAKDALAALDSGGGVADTFDALGEGDFDEGALLADIEKMMGDLQTTVDKWLEDWKNSIPNPWDWIKEKWETFTKWWHDNVHVDLSNIFGGDAGGALGAIGGFFSTIEDTVRNVLGSDIWNAFGHIFEYIGRVAGKWWKFIKEAATDLWNTLQDKFSGWSDVIRPAINLLKTLGDVGKALFITLSAVFGGILLVVTWAFDQLLPYIKPIWDNIVAIISGAIDIIHGIILVALGILTGDWQAAWDGVIYILQGAWSIISGQFHMIFGLIDAVWEDLKTITKAAWEYVVSKTLEKIGELINWIGGLAGRLVEAVADPGRDIWNAVSPGFTLFYDNVSAVINGIGEFFRAIPGVIGEVAPKVWDAAVDIGGKIWGGIKSALTGVWDIAGDILGGLKNGLYDLINNGVIGKLEQGINSVLDGIHIPFTSVGIPHITIPRISFHSGGIVPGAMGTEVPAVLQAGERVLSIQQTAAINHLFDDLGGLAAKGGGNTVVINGDLSFPNVTDGSDAEDFISNLEALAVS